MLDLRNRALRRRTLAARGPVQTHTETTALTPAADLSTTYLRDADNGYPGGAVYGRADNASVKHAEGLIAELEHARAGMLFSSGMAAAISLFTALDPTHVVAPSRMFWGLKQWLCEARHGHHVTFVDMADLAAVGQAVLPGLTRLVWVETPSNPLWTITDIEAVSDLAHRAGAVLCADSTASTPILTQPLRLGADMVMHSATKYLNGHSDVVAGVLATARTDGLWAEIHKGRWQQGVAAAPMDAWLLARGLRTLDLRIREQSRSAEILAQRLVGHPAIDQVLYPGLPGHPGRGIAERQMSGGFGGMLSLRMKGGEPACVAVAARMRLWRRATSFGGVESLIEHRASIEGEGSDCPDDLLRLSVGLEDADDLHDDLIQALGGAG